MHAVELFYHPDSSKLCPFTEVANGDAGTIHVPISMTDIVQCKN